MTDARATQVSVEQFATASSFVQATQVALEMWASALVSIPGGQALMTQATVEQWASVASISATAQARVMVMA